MPAIALHVFRGVSWTASLLLNSVVSMSELDGRSLACSGRVSTLEASVPGRACFVYFFHRPTGACSDATEMKKVSLGDQELM